MCNPTAAVIGIASAASYSAQKSAAKKAEEAQRRAEEAAAKEAERQRQLEIERQNRITEGRTSIDGAFGQFDDDFYGGRSQAYQGYAMPELEDQFQDSMRSLVAALARSGNLQSSTRAEKMADLQEQYNQRKLDIYNTGMDYANQARSNVDAARNELYTQNQSLADPNLISGNAAARAATLNQMPSFSPLGQLFSDFTAGLATQSDLERRQINQYDQNPLFSLNNGGSGKVVGG
jgi:hypothetical protein